MDRTFGNWARGPKNFGELLQKRKIKSLQVLKGEFEKWEREANMIISVDDWQEIIGQQWRSTCSLSWREKRYQVL